MWRIDGGAGCDASPNMNMIEKSKNINEIAITLDLDWAPDFFAAEVADSTVLFIIKAIA